MCLTLMFPQNQGLEVISEGLDTLKSMAHDMNEVCFLLLSICYYYFWFILI